MIVLFIAYSSVYCDAYNLRQGLDTCYIQVVWWWIWYLLCLCFDYFRFDRDWKKIEAFIGSKTV